MYNVKIVKFQQYWRDTKRQTQSSKSEQQPETNEDGSPMNGTNKTGTVEEESQDGKDEEEQMEGIDEKEDKFVTEILTKFLVGTEATFLDEVNLMLMVMALSNRLVSQVDLENFKMFNMSTVQ